MFLIGSARGGRMGILSRTSSVSLAELATPAFPESEACQDNFISVKKLRDCEAKLTNWSNIDVQICIVTLNQSVFTLATFCLQKCKGQSSLLALAT
jgi:hypothetical protein